MVGNRRPVLTWLRSRSAGPARAGCDVCRRKTGLIPEITKGAVAECRCDDIQLIVVVGRHRRLSRGLRPRAVTRRHDIDFSERDRVTQARTRFNRVLLCWRWNRTRFSPTDTRGRIGSCALLLARRFQVRLADPIEAGSAATYAQTKCAEGHATTERRE